jgi:hypothetical protein
LRAYAILKGMVLEIERDFHEVRYRRKVKAAKRVRVRMSEIRHHAKEIRDLMGWFIENEPEGLKR